MMNFSQALFSLFILSCATAVGAADPVIDVGSRRQLFVDGHLIQRMKGVRQILHRPIRREIAIKPELVTKPMKFSGHQLRLNYSTSAVGSAQVEIQDAAGKPIPGFELKNCVEHYGDKIDGGIAWKSEADLQSLIGKAVRLRF